MPIEEYMQWIGAEDVPGVMDGLKTSLESQVPFLQEYRIAQPGRPAVWVACRGEMIYGPGQVAARMNGVVVDITERKWMKA